MYKYITLFMLLLGLNLNAQSLPKLQKQGTATQLIVDGKPYLMLAGELHNSSCSNIEYMESIWHRMKQLNMNTILAPVAWEQIEPVEGQFDFSLLDAMIQGAEKSGLKLVILWFGSWKNGSSTYVPSWVKKDFKRFPRAVDQNGKSIEILSTFSDESMKADAKAFAAFMKHLRESDKNRTVIMIQVENEVGVLNTVRDFLPAANKAFNSSIPQDLLSCLSKNKNNLTPEFLKIWRDNGSKTSGSWEEVFGKSIVDEKNWRSLSYYTEELFMAYHYARYINYIAQEGKKEYNIPMYVNAWLKGPDQAWSGRFPGGGPLPQVMDMWRCAAPSIDFLAPDIYLPNFREIVENYDRLGNAIFIPETRGGDIASSRALWVIGEHNSMGFSPFGVDGIEEEKALAETYRLINSMSDLILQNQGKGTMRGILVDKENPKQSFELGNYKITADAYNQKELETSAAGGLIIQLGSDEYMVLGRNLNVRFAPKTTEDLPFVGIDKVYEGIFKDRVWIHGRLLNGDETFSAGLKMLGTGIQRITLYRFR